MVNYKKILRGIKNLNMITIKIISRLNKDIGE